MKRFLIILLLLSFPAGAVSLKPSAEVDSRDVMLSDIFDGITDDRRVAAAPEPLRSFVLDAGFLSQIAKGYGLDWKVKTGYESIRVSRPGRYLENEIIAAGLKDALLGKGVDDSYDVEILVKDMVALPLGIDPTLEFLEVGFNDKSNIAMAMLIIREGNEILVKERITARIFETAEIPVAKNTISPGKPIGDNDVEFSRVRIDELRQNILVDIDEIKGRVAKRNIRPGMFFAANDIKEQVLVNKGKAVRIIFKKPNLTLTAVGKALDNGTMDEVVRVMNPSSKKVIEAVVTAAGIVSVSEI